MVSTHEPPPPYQPRDPSNPAATSATRNPVIFCIGCPLQRDYFITPESQSGVSINAQANEWSLKPDLAFYLNDASNRELASCDFKEKTCSADITMTKTSNGDKETLWWSAMDQETLMTTQYRIMARVHDANPLNIAGLSLTSPRPFIWGSSSGWKLVDELTGNVAAIARDVELSAGKYGSVEILMSYGDNFTLIALTSYLAICEKLKREAKKHRMW
ncbi:hypothetical protein N7478_006661 [Penicillium angulare]|uniref:uncharacterized protein n=1 Tax=Penicillium angulare TaxID=116970 RepID=UPI0025423C85|nr:uncharacterized protein N7478_006661 [Penicillium angulare]KAJ5281289.1 hypothetical protein N7478_006661 [Penicillium angulare]